VQVADARARSNYYIVVEPDPSQLAGSGNYALNIEFTQRAAPLRTFASGVLSGPSQERLGNLFVAETQLFHLLLAAESPLGSGSAIQMTISDATDATVYSLIARAGDIVSGPSILLSPGAYTVRLMSVSTSPIDLDATPSPMRFLLLGADLDEPIGPTIDDPTQTPVYTCPAVPRQFCYPTGAVSPAPFLWDFTIG
jgi:hypothetical protein